MAGDQVAGIGQPERPDRPERAPGGGLAGVLRAGPEGTSVRLRVVPGARRTELAGVTGGVLRLRVAAPPVESKANRAVLEFLAERLGVRRRDLRLTAGQRGRDKTVLVAGLSPARCRAALTPDDAARANPSPDRAASGDES